MDTLVSRHSKDITINGGENDWYKLNTYKNMIQRLDNAEHATVTKIESW